MPRLSDRAGAQPLSLASKLLLDSSSFQGVNICQIHVPSGGMFGPLALP